MNIEYISSLFEFAGGIGMFLYGMNTMADGMQRSAGGKMKKLLGYLTSNRLLAIIVGAVITAIIQSSGATTVMVVGFVNAGLMTLVQAVGVIMGANIGTTITAWIVSLGQLGDAAKVMNPSFYAPFLIGIGAFVILFSKKDKVKNAGEIIVGIGLLFEGLTFMSSSIAPYTDAPIFSQAFQIVGSNPFLGILIGIIVGYIIALCFGMINFSAVANASWFALPQFMHFGVKFNPAACVAIAVLFAINSIQAIGDFSATTTGGMDRMPTDEELNGGIVAYGLTNIFCAFFGGLPTATYSQNVGIVGSTKVVSKKVFGIAASIILVAGLIPKFSSLLTTIPYCVLGGATVSVFASIAMTGIKLIASHPMDFRNTTVVGLAVALGMGVTQANAALASFPSWVTTIFGKSPVVLATITAIVLNLILPKNTNS